jgi:Na+/H+-dicarboxylate symporter
MMALIQGVSKIYGMLLRLFPRDFQNEFKEEMEDVFTANLDEASKTGATLVVRACFFELFDLPANLLVEHLSNLRKGNIIKTLSYEVGRSRAVLMAALGMSVGWVLINWEGRQYFHTLAQLLQSWEFDLVQTIVSTLPVVLCGLMLGISVGVGRRAFLRIGLWTAAGGILGHLVTFPVRMVNTAILARVATLPRWESDLVGMLALLAVMCTYGFFYGAGLGFAFGGWKTCLKFALIGLVANAVGILAGYFISSGVSSRVQLGTDLPSYITWSIMGALAGGILGWFFGKERQPEADPVIRKSNA